jgi:hypothetical protein
LLLLTRSLTPVSYFVSPQVQSQDETIDYIRNNNEWLFKELEKDQGEEQLLKQLRSRSLRLSTQSLAAIAEAGDHFPDCENARKAYLAELIHITNELGAALGIDTSPNAGHALAREKGGNIK